MPTVGQSGPYRVFFYSSDGKEPPHVHVRRESCTAKLWLLPVRVARNDGFSDVELRRISELMREREIELRKAWRDFFGK